MQCQILAATALLNGKDKDAREVRSIVSLALNTHVAVCDEDFCENGGMCLYPDTNCTCPHGWEGDQCETGKPDIILGHVLHFFVSTL